MKNLRRIFLFALFLLTCSAGANEKISLIPQPTYLKPMEGKFTLTGKTTIAAEAVLQPVAALFAETLGRATGHKIAFASEGSIEFRLDASMAAELGTEGYTVDVAADKITVKAASEAGVFYATQTLLQLLPPEIMASSKKCGIEWAIPCVSIRDVPRFGWRGYMLDVSRTFYNVEFLKKYIDVMSLYKLNTLHLHLTDDQGWRIEIKKYPLLTSKIATTFHESENQPAQRSGFYTQQQIRELVKYAGERFVTIVPEIDVPGHSWATLLVYPQLGANENHNPSFLFPFCSSWGYWGHQFTPNTLDPTKESVYQFLDDVLSEVAELFPADYIHFGGDEVVHSIWEKEPHIQTFMKERGMKNTNDLQNYFVDRVSKIVQSKGKKPIGWNDILADAENLTKGTAIMAWLGADAITKAAENGFYTVAAPTAPLYFDITQSDRNDGTHADLAYGNINTLEWVYSYNPTDDVKPEYHRYILGVQANIWTHVALEVKDVNVQTFPRLIALAEVGWSAEKDKNFTEFQQRLNASKAMLDELRIDYFRPGGYIAGSWNPQMLTTAYAPVEWDVTKKIYANGRVNAGFFYTSGDNFMEVAKVELLENGKPISEETHYGLADKFRGTNKTKTFLYALAVDNYKPDAKYTLRATVRGAGGTDSNGNLTFNLCPYQPFMVVEPR